MAEVTLVLGGARSGKSGYAQRVAEAWAARTGGALVFVATAEALDTEMAGRIARHRGERDGRWRTLEAPRDLAPALAALGPAEGVVVDCLTLWLSNRLLDETLEGAADELCEAVARCAAPLWLVSNEVGLGVVPDNAVARRFRDEAGRLNQAMAAAAQRVVLLTAGLPLVLKGPAA